MSGEVPLGLEEDDNLLFDERPPRAWRRGVIAGLVVLGVLAASAIGVMIYLGVVVMQRQGQQLSGGPAPATPGGQGPLDEVMRFKPGGYVQAIGGGDVDGDGQADAVVWAGKNITIRDATGQEEAAFPSRLSELKRAPAVGRWTSPTPGGGIRTPQVGRLRGKPAIVVTDGESDSVYAYNVSGGVVLKDRVPNTHVRRLAVADLNGDGDCELLVGRSASVGLVCVDSVGHTKWKHGSPTDPSWVHVGDGNGDGRPEVFVGYDTGVTQILDSNGRHIGNWTQWALANDAQCADLDGDGRVEFLLSRSLTPGGPGSAGSTSRGGAGQGGLSAGFGLELQGVRPDGTPTWTQPPLPGPQWVGRLHLAHGDLNGDGRGEWVASVPDGSVRVYDVAGNELGAYALGQEVQAMAVIPPGRTGAKASVWVSLGEEIVVLRWQ